MNFQRYAVDQTKTKDQTAEPVLKAPIEKVQIHKNHYHQHILVHHRSHT